MMYILSANEASIEVIVNHSILAVSYQMLVDNMPGGPVFSTVVFCNTYEHQDSFL